MYYNFPCRVWHLGDLNLACVDFGPLHSRRPQVSHAKTMPSFSIQNSCLPLLEMTEIVRAMCFFMSFHNLQESTCFLCKDAGSSLQRCFGEPFDIQGFLMSGCIVSKAQDVHTGSSNTAFFGSKNTASRTDSSDPWPTSMLVSSQFIAD